MNTECYNNVIGLARQQCPCSPQGPTNFSTSLSGLYLADIAPLSEVGNYNDCSPGGVWDVLDNARTNAVTSFIADASALLMRYNKLRREAWKGGIGMAEHKGALNTGSAFQGLRICGGGIKGGEMVIDAIGTQFLTGGTFNVVFYDWQGMVVATRSVTATAGKHNITALSSPVTLQMHDDYRALPEYYVTYATASAPTPVASRIACGCGPTQDYYYNRDSPVFSPMKSGTHLKASRTNGWARWIMLGGWKGDNVDFSDETATADNQNYGLTLHAAFDCKVHEVLCDGHLNFSKPLTMSLAYAVQFKAAELAIDNLLSTTQINRFQITNREALEKKRTELMKKYNEHLNYIASEIDVDSNDCLTCQSILGATMSGVFA